MHQAINSELFIEVLTAMVEEERAHKETRTRHQSKAHTQRFMQGTSADSNDPAYLERSGASRPA